MARAGGPQSHEVSLLKRLPNIGSVGLEVPRHFLETLADQMADPEKWAYMLREHARTIRKQLALVEKASSKGRRPPGTF